MTTWRLRLRPLSPWATPWRADSLFGAICWRWLELFPESFESMLTEFHEGWTPPFILSDAWPSDLMPVPAHVVPAGPKKLRPPLYMPAQSFRSIMGGETLAALSPTENVIGQSARIQTAIDREMGSAADGQLFETGTQHLNAPFDYLSVYIRSDHRIEQVTACLRALAWTGFGKKSSTGLGQFEAGAAPERCDWLDEVPGANAWMAINHFVPAPGDPVDGRWRTHVTFPKFHGNAVSNVFKGSILMLTPGSVFRTGKEPPRPWYGSMIPMPRPEMPRALHYGLCFPVPMLWSREAL
jgi:CRISPR-associated protein Csm4